MISSDLRVDVTDAVGLGDECELRGTIWSPAPEALPSNPWVLVAVPGGTYPRTYWHLEVPSRSGYSFAEHMCARGHVVVSFDNLGTADSTRPLEPEKIGFEAVADANVAAARHVVDQLRAGTSALEAFPPVGDLRVAGIGHSMGGHLTAVAQARHELYERVAILGSSFLGNVNAGSGARLADDDARALAEERMRLLAGASWASGYLEPSREQLRGSFHAADVPPDVLAADDAGATVILRNLAVGSIASQTLVPYASAIDVPVFVTFADIDMSPDPRAEVAVYASSRDVTLFLLAGSAHCHNSATTRHQLWDRLATWLESEIGPRSPSAPS